MDTNPISVLLVDDDEDDYVMTRDLLSEVEGGGMTLDWVATYDAALEAIGRHQHDVYLVDYRLGGRNGLELLRQALANGCQAPVILLTGQGHREVDIEAMWAGAADYLVKGQISACLLERSIRYALKHKRAEQALRESEERFRQLAENIHEVFWLAEWRTRQVNYVSPAYETIWGRSIRGLYKDSADWINAIHPDDRQRIVEAYFDSATAEGLDLEYRIIRPDGSVRWVRDRAFLIRDQNGQVYRIAGVAEDITRRKQMEEELLKAQKLESISLLAGGIAHDFNNVLMGIMGNISLARMYARPGDEMYERLAEADKAAMRARDLTQQLLTFSRGGAPIKKTAAIADIIKDTVGFALRGSNVSCKFSIPEDLRPVEVDEGQISQVIQNLIINADQAMPQGGIIHLQAENVAIAANQGLPLPAGQYVKILVEDHGVGIPPEHLTKIFDPYFTTKQKGSGLGLTTAYSIIRQHGGHITVESELGVGTTFSIYLPASQKEIVTRPEREANPVIGQGRVLVMDDEEIIRQVTGHMLTRVGYKVECARDGAEAIKLYQQAKASGRPFDVMIMDLTIPGGMGGKEAIQKLREIDPQVKAIVSSGYSNDPIMAEFRQYGFVGCVAKPYKVQDLTQAVYQVINGHE